jgi:hypothetical protein
MDTIKQVAVSCGSNSPADASFNGAFAKPRGMWLFYTWVVVAIPSAAHAVIGAYDPEALGWIDPKFVGMMAALRYFGLDCSAPGLTGPLSQQFYVNQVGFSVWGVIFSTINTTVYVLSGKMRVADPEASVRRMIKAKGCSAREAEAQLHYMLLWLVLPLTALFVVLFLNGVYGWTPFHIQSADCFKLMFFSVGFICMSGTAVLPLTLALAIWLRRDIRKLLKLPE